MPVIHDGDPVGAYESRPATGDHVSAATAVAGAEFVHTTRGGVNAPKFDALTGLRFFAAFFVFVVHANAALRFEHTGLLDGVPVGLCVCLFFVLSGFVLTHVYTKVDSRVATKNFWVARIGRLWPLHFTTFALVLLLGGIPPIDWCNWKNVLANVFMVQDWFPSEKIYLAFNVPAWSISVECFFYFMFPFLIAGRHKLVGPFLALTFITAMVAIFGTDALIAKTHDLTLATFVSRLPITRLFEFVLGVQTYLLFKQFGNRVRNHPAFWATVETAAAGALIAWLVFGTYWTADCLHPFGGINPHPTVRNWISCCAPAPVCALLIFCLASECSIVARFLRRPSIVYLGEISFALYLMHFPFLQLINMHPFDYDAVPPLMKFAVLFVVVFLASAVSYQMIECPARDAFRRWFGDKRGLPKNIKKSKSGLSSNLLRPLNLAQAVLLVVLVAGCMAYPDLKYRFERSSLSQPVSFGKDYVLKEVCWGESAGAVRLRLKWQACRSQSGDAVLGVHLVDAAHKIVEQKDRPLLSTISRVEKNYEWTDEIPLSSFSLASVQNVGIAVYYREPFRPLRALSGPRDSYDVRLLLPVPERVKQFSPVAKQSNESHCFGA